jgi:YqxM protein
MKIRYTRVNKFTKKRYGFMLSVQILTIFYTLVVGTSFLTSNTEAYFNDNSQVTGIIQAGFWENEWDKSSLTFLGVQDQLFESCGPKEISVRISNTGSNMKGPSQYEVYYISKGNPMKGEKVGEGIIDPILANQSGTLNFTAAKSGNYKFRALQRPNHGNKAERQDLWSETITINCTQNKENIEPDEEKNISIPNIEVPVETNTEVPVPAETSIEVPVEGDSTLQEENQIDKTTNQSNADQTNIQNDEVQGNLDKSSE